MGFLSIVHSDVGIKKNTNQDSVLIKEAVTDYGEVFLAVVCDGMGGLAKGEVASAALIRAFSDWFENRFPLFLYEKRTEDGIDRKELENDLNRLVLEINGKIAEHGKQFHVAMGTTAALILFAEGRYYICLLYTSGRRDPEGHSDQSDRECPYAGVYKGHAHGQ